MGLFNFITKRVSSNIRNDVSGQVNPMPADPRAPQMVLLPWEQGREVYTGQDMNMLMNQYTSWVYVCSTMNSNAVASSTLRLYSSANDKNTKFIVSTKSVSRDQLKRFESFPHLQKYIRKAVDVQEITEHPFYDLMNRVNPIMNRFDLWDMSEIHLELAGNSYWFISKDAMGVPNEIWVLPPQYTKIVADKSKLILGYVFERGTVKIPFDYDEVIHFKFSSPINQLYGLGPLTAALETVDYDKSIRTFDKTMMKNMGRPEAVLETEQIVGPDVFKRLKEEWQQNYQGATKVGKTLILESGLKYKPITMNPKDMNYLQGRKMNREEIAAIFGVPISKLTSEAVNLANAKVGRTQYQEDTIEPRLRRLEEKINEKLMPMYADNLFVAFDSTVPEDNEFHIRARDSRLRNYMTTINEERAVDGKDPVPWGDKPLVMPGVAPLGEAPPKNTPPPNIPLEPPAKVVSDENIALFVDNVIKSIRQKIIAQN